MKHIQDQTFDEERALYGISDTVVEGCTFAGPADGESAFKETKNVRVKDCRFLLRYPFWHTEGALIEKITMADTCRAALWYCRDVTVTDSDLGGIKALRECRDVRLERCHVVSPEFGWGCKDVTFTDCDITSEYFLMRSENVILERVHLTGKYSFQYCKNVTVRDCVLETKDAFWESENVTVENSVVNGEYLAWYSKGLRLVGCSVKGTQPLCYARGLVLEDCTMEACDLSFEYSEVQADLRGTVDSVKNPLAGSHIVADGYGEIIFDAHRRDGGAATVEVRK